MKLNSGYEMPDIGLGTWKSKPGEVGQAVEVALDAGYKHIDGAWVYFNEDEVGDAIQKKLADNTIKREELFVTTKLWCNFHQPSDVRMAFMKSLTALKLDYIDLYLMHFPVGFKRDPDEDIDGVFMPLIDGELVFDTIDYVETWKANGGMKKEGLVRSIGVSNFNKHQCKRIMEECETPPAVNQIEIHPYLPNNDDVNWCQENGIVVTSYSPFGSPDRPWAKDEKPILGDEKIVALAEKYDKNAGQVVLRYLYQRKLIIIPKSVTPSRIRGNLEIFDFELSREDCKVFEEMTTTRRVCWGPDVFPTIAAAKYFPFPDGEYKE